MGKDDELQKAILNNIPDQAWLKDKDSRYILVNDAFIAACRLPESEILHKTPADVWPEESVSYTHLTLPTILLV